LDNQELFDKVNKVIENDVRHFIEADGGKIKLKKIENGIAYVELKGACASCPALSMTLYGGIERIIKQSVEGIHSVKLA
jgi:Fe-S cluster biogenesis protein NfuA